MITISLMVLLALLAVAMLTLGSIAIRSSGHTNDAAIARANARMALMLALGELQKSSGLDTRVTARADILDPDHPPVLGVWKSWEGSNHTTRGTYAGRPISPGDYPSAKEARFLSWLASDPSGPLTRSASPPSAKAGSGTVALVGEGSVGKGEDRKNFQIHLLPTQVAAGDQFGSLAWWVSGENQKARLPSPYEPDTDGIAAWSSMVKSHAVADPGVFGMDRLLEDAEPAEKAITLDQADFVADPTGRPASDEFFHDLTPHSVGLLTNTATGGWRKDLSLLTETWNRQPISNQPFFRVEPGRDIGFNMPSGSLYRPDRSLFYPWSSYRGQSVPIYEHGAVSSWANLQNWATLYKTMSASGGSISPFSVAIDASDPAAKFNFLHKVRILPIIARVQWVFSHWGARISDAAYEPRLLVTPVVTLWNPYNVAITSSPLEFRVVGCLPNAFRFTVGAVQNQRYNSISASTNNSPSLGGGDLWFNITGSHSFKPGETLLFSPTGQPVASSNKLTLQPGFRKGGGHFFPLRKDDNSSFSVPGASVVKAEAKFNSSYNDAGAVGVGIYLDMMVGIGGPRHLVYRMIYDPALAEQVYRPLTGLAQSDLLKSSSDPQPFLTTVFGARTASKTHLSAKGFVQTSPLVNYTAMGDKDRVESTIQWDYPGTAHPVNSPFDYSFERLAGAGDSMMPGSDAANRGFIVTGFQSADGLSRCIIAEIPTRPLHSLAELQNWDLRYENPIPPYAFNLIGNSDASPLLPANAVFNSGNSAKGTQDLQHDDSYCANHLLFDDWFVSSIAPNSQNLGRPSGTETLKKAYLDFLSGTTPLPNRAYRPILADAAAAGTAAGANDIYVRYVEKADSWKVIASRLEVEGMFNVNSTSVKAWRALLGHARGQRIPHVTPAGNRLSDEVDYAYSRFAVAGDSGNESRGTSGLFSTSAEFAGFRTLDEAMLDRFAEEIVDQVRQRGPFLSLAEFVNRQLSSGDLALAGTIQSALNALSENGSMDPFKTIKSAYPPDKLSQADPPPAGTSGYQFKEAAAGYPNAYGLPGWTRQADVLRPLAPILSARDDTFTIRAYGDAKDSSGKVTARAYCEAVVRRTRDYVDPADAAEITGSPKSAANQTFGRRYSILSFRWLNPSEI
ncbi:MAG: hypothetical protein MUF31_11555 [Akkermansiaceae bacterium]|nr:hypothetical protein [Akkermansiaceae bacterium]